MLCFNIKSRSSTVPTLWHLKKLFNFHSVALEKSNHTSKRLIFLLLGFTATWTESIYRHYRNQSWASVYVVSKVTLYSATSFFFDYKIYQYDIWYLEFLSEWSKEENFIDKTLNLDFPSFLFPFLLFSSFCLSFSGTLIILFISGYFLH